VATRGQRVFVIDDDHSVCRGLARLLDAAGFRVETFESGPAFLRRAPPKGEHCLVVDVRMPEMTGLELRDALRAKGRDSPLIFITAHELDEHEIGMDTVLWKPIEADLLVHAIKAAIGNVGRSRPLRRARIARR
jgi:two-component system, LuxR family, response regulator FixJ